MPYNGSGVFNRLYSWVADAAAEIDMLPTKFDNDGNDVAAALNNCLTRDGQGQPTADTPWNGHKITGLATATNAGDAVNFALAGSIAADGGCYFQYTNGTTCTLVPRNGGNLSIGGGLQVIPPAGVTLSSTGGLLGGGNLLANTLYYVYAYMVGATVTLGASTTGYTVDSTGRANMTGDSTKRLVGMVYPGAGAPGVFTDNQLYNGVASYFNRALRWFGVNSQATSVSSTSLVLSQTLMVAFLSWGDFATWIGVDGYCYNATALSNNSSAIYIDGVQIGATVVNYISAANAQVNAGQHVTNIFALGVHSAALYGAASSLSSGAATFVTQGNCLVWS